jgi:Domain of unknown function (DUF1835)/Protein of unknown function
MAGNSVREALMRLGREEEVLSFHDALTEGPLSDVDAGPASRVAWWSRVRGGPLEPAEAEEFDDASIWSGVRQDRRRVVLWHGPHANEHLYALRACWMLRNEPARLYEVRLGVRPPRPHGWAAPAFYSAVSIVGPNALVVAWETCAAINDVGPRATRWEELRNRLGEWHRDLEGDEIIHLPLDAFDLPIIDACQGSWRDSALVVGHVLAHRATGDRVLASRVRELLARGVLEGRGDENRMGLPGQVRPIGRP